MIDPIKSNNWHFDIFIGCKFDSDLLMPLLIEFGPRPKKYINVTFYLIPGLIKYLQSLSKGDTILYGINVLGEKLIRYTFIKSCIVDIKCDDLDSNLSNYCRMTVKIKYKKLIIDDLYQTAKYSNTKLYWDQ